MYLLQSKIANDNSRLTGVALVVVSAIVFSTAGIFTKGVSAGSWEIIFWRGVFAAGFTFAYVIWRKGWAREVTNMGVSGVIIAVINASGTAAFIPALKLTSMANVALIYAASPLIAALLAWLWIGERLTRKLALGCFLSFVGVAIIFQGSVGGINFKGDLLALWMTCALAIIMVIYRRYPDTPAAGPAALSSLILLPAAIMYGLPFSVLANELASLAVFGLVFAIASVTLAEGAKRLSAGDTGLLSALETPLAPLFGWLIFMEIPATASFVGGALVLVAVIGTQI